MTATETFNEKLAELSSTVQAKLKELKEGGATDSEVREKVDQMAADVQSLKEGAAQMRDRSAPPGDYVASGVDELVDKGVESFARRDDEGNPVGVGAHHLSGESILDGPQELLSKDARAVLRLADEVYICDRIMALHGKTKDAYQSEKMRLGEEEAFTRRFPALAKRYKAVVDDMTEKAGLDTQTATGGSDWIPTGFASNALDEIRVALPEVGIFPHIDMPTNPWTWPIVGSIAQSYIRSENVDVTQSDPTTASRTWTAKTFAVWSAWSDEVGQDSIIPILPFLRSNHFRSMGEAFSVACVSGDTTSLHMDNDYQAEAASHPAKAFDGLREYCMGGSGADDTNYSDHPAGGDLDTAAILDALEKMGKWAAGLPSQLALLVDSKGYVQLLGQTETLTVDKFGPQATIQTGELARILGIPIFMSFGVEERKNLLNLAGVNVASTGQAFSTAILVNRNYWYIGDRRDVRVETDKRIQSGQNDIVTSARWAFNKTHATQATQNHTFCINHIGT